MFARNDPSKNFSIYLNLPPFFRKKLNIKYLIAGKILKKLKYL